MRRQWGTHALHEKLVGGRHGRRSIFAPRALLLAACLIAVGDATAHRPHSASFIQQARADDNYERREQMRRQYEERRQRDEDRRERDDERRQRMIERQQREAERAQASAERDARRVDPESRDGSYARDPGSGASREASDGKYAGSRDAPPSASARGNDKSRKDDGKDDKDDNEESKSGQGSGPTADDLAEDYDQPEPATLVEWFDRLAGPKRKPAHSNGKADVSSRVSPVLGAHGKANRDATAKLDGKAGEPARQTQPGDSVKKAPSAPAAKAVSADAAKSAHTAPDGSPKRGKTDFELLQMGSFKRHEIVASRLDAAAGEHLRALGFQTAARVFAPGDALPVQKLIVPKGMNEAAALALLEKEAPKAHFGPNHVYRITPAADAVGRSYPVKAAAKGGAVSDAEICSGDKCFARKLMHWSNSLNRCAQRVRVGIIDTSFDTSHPAFAGRTLDVASFRGQSALANGDWHGTAVLSVLAGGAGSDTPGLVPDAQFLLASTFATDADGQVAADAVSVLRALAWLDSRNADIVNMSFSGPPNAQIETAISAMAAKGVVFVAAAGNRGANGPPSYPAAYPQVIAVTAIGKDMRSYRHANQGDYVDVAAPGVNIWTALPNARGGYRTGTSFAAPFVTGLLAAMPAARKNIRSKNDVLSRISMQDLGAPGRDPTYGEGLPIAPQRCNEVGGVASLPWTEEAKRMSVGGPVTGSVDYEPASPSQAPGAAMSAFGFAQ